MRRRNGQLSFQNFFVKKQNTAIDKIEVGGTSDKGLPVTMDCNPHRVARQILNDIEKIL